MTNLEHNPFFSNVLEAGPSRTELGGGGPIGRDASRPATIVWRVVLALGMIGLVAAILWLGAQAAEWAATAVEGALQEITRWLAVWPHALQIR